MQSKDMLCYAMCCNWCLMLCVALVCSVILRYDMLCRVKVWNVILWLAVRCDDMLYCDMLCIGM